ncbi:hypothetical protein F5Y11DRAFT_140238 [Daldinia sp. FL1419]|nr:hypothetical protein F5Y11DRAFT_140238 [Daldinia sp. FL1419]
MSSVNYLNEEVSSTNNNAGSQQAASGQNPPASSDDPIHTRMNEFIEEPLDSGNRNVMLPDRGTDVDVAIRDSQKRMEKGIESTAKALEKPEMTNAHISAQNGGS